jgi:hypothetical protein
MIAGVLLGIDLDPAHRHGSPFPVNTPLTYCAAFAVLSWPAGG